MKKFIFFFIAFLTLCATQSFAQTDYPLYVGGWRVTSANMNNIDESNVQGTVKYDPTTKTLTLNNVR